MKTVWEFHRKHTGTIVFRCARKAQSATALSQDVQRRAFQAVVGSKTARHPGDWP